MDVERPLIARVFAELSDGQFHSGEDLAQALGVSRSAVWKAVKSLRDLGATLHAVRNRGYRLAKSSEPLAAERILEKLSERFLQAIDYYGLVELEYKLDPRDGQYKLLDVNARTWGYHSLGAAAGVDFSHMLYADQVGLPVSPSIGRSGVSWMRTTTDVPAAVMGILSGDTSLNSYLRSLVGCDTEAVFSLSDPAPGLAEVALIPYLAIKRGF